MMNVDLPTNGDTGSVGPPPPPQGCVYTSCYCEENIYLLAQALCAEADRPAPPRWTRLWDIHVVFVSNEDKTVRALTSRPQSLRHGWLFTRAVGDPGRGLLQTPRAQSSYPAFAPRSPSGIRKLGTMSWCGTTMSYSSSGRDAQAAILQATEKYREHSP